MTQAQTHTDGARGAGAILVLALVAHIAAAFIAGPFTPDDSYISFRFAENFASGHGFAFNAGNAPVEAYSNFLWIIFCVVIHGVGLPLPLAAPLVSVLFGAGTIALLWLYYRRRHVAPSVVIVPLLLAALAGPFVLYSVSGLETTLFAFLLMLSIVIFDTARSGGWIANVALALVGVLVALCRPEGVLAYPVLFFVLVWANRRGSEAGRISGIQLIAGMAAFVLLYGAYTAWRVNYFGSFLPTPFSAKGPSVASIPLLLRSNMRTYFVGSEYGYAPAGYYFVMAAVAAWFGLRRRSGQAGCWSERAAAIVAVTYLLVYLAFRDWMPGMRYQAPVLPLFFVPAIFAPMFESLQSSARRTRVVLACVALAAGAASLMPIRIAAQNLERGTRKCLIPVADWITKNVPDAEVLAISDVGVIPYFTGMHTIDINPGSLTDLHIARNGFSANYVYSKEPDVVIVVSRGLFRPRLYPEHFEMVSSPEFTERFRFVGASRYLWQEDRSYWVYLTNRIPPLSSAAVVDFPTGVGGVRRTGR